MLSTSQKAAIDYINSYAKKRKGKAIDDIGHVLKMSNISWELYNQAINKIRQYARIAMHFHPDRPGPENKTVAESLLESGIYKSQFETFISNGSVSAFPGGERDLWEKQIFNGAYNLDGSTNAQRPKYGSLDLMHHPDGPSPRFGSCYFLLKPSVLHRCTFTYLDSHRNPDKKGTVEEFDDIMCGLLNEIFERDFGIGEKEIMPANLIHHLIHNLEKPYQDLIYRENRRNLNHYIEAQVHGEINLKRDAEILVIDPSFQDTPTGDILKELCKKHEIQLFCHPGYALKLDEIPSDFRGPTMPSLAKRIAEKDFVSVADIGKAAMDLKLNPARWADRGTYKKVLQELKLLWHVLVKYGQPFKQIH